MQADTLVKGPLASHHERLCVRGAAEAADSGLTCAQTDG